LTVGLMGFVPVNQSEYTDCNPQFCTETWALALDNYVREIR